MRILLEIIIFTSGQVKKGFKLMLEAFRSPISDLRSLIPDPTS